MPDNENMQHYVIPIGDSTVHLYCSDVELPLSLTEATDESDRLLEESGGNWKKHVRPIPLSNRWTARRNDRSPTHTRLQEKQ